MKALLFACLFALLCLKSVKGLDDALVTEMAYMDMEIEGSHAGRVEIGLFGGTAPKTVRNFVALANHEVSVSSLRYIVTMFICVHRKAMATGTLFFTE